jgi:CTP synthase (UTP-ammonia lyase)
VTEWGVRIAIVGDYQPDHETHPATTAACEHAAAAVGVQAEIVWVSTTELAGSAEGVLQDFDGVWIAPGSPYQSLAGALDAIRFARTWNLPLIGTCAGFQHVIIEYARNVLEVSDAQHGEYDPHASALFITALACSLAGQTMTVQLVPHTSAASAYGTTSATERYYCNFGLNHDYLPALEAGGLAVSGVDQDGEVRVVELPDHRFFVATLFVPQVSSTDRAPHPLAVAFIATASGCTEQRTG